MRNTFLTAAAALALLAIQVPGQTNAAQASELRRYENATTLQQQTAPQRTRALAQSEGSGRGETMYGRKYGQAEAPTVPNVRRYAQAEAPTVANVRRYGQAEAPTVANVRRYAQAEQTGANNGRFRQAQAEQTGVNAGRLA